MYFFTFLINTRKINIFFSVYHQISTQYIVCIFKSVDFIGFFNNQKFLNNYINGKKIDLITSEQILNSSSEEGRRVRAIFSNLLAIFCRNSALMWGAKGGVYLSGSIVNTLMERISLEEFRQNFEKYQR